MTHAYQLLILNENREEIVSFSSDKAFNSYRAGEVFNISGRNREIGMVGYQVTEAEGLINEVTIVYLKRNVSRTAGFPINQPHPLS